MPTKTFRNDWLNDGLAMARFIVSACPSTSKRYLDNGILTLRFAAHFPPNMQPPNNLTQEQRRGWLPSHYQLMMGFLVVELSTQLLVDQFSPNQKLMELVEYIRRYFLTPIAVVVISEEVSSTGMGSHFWVDDEQLNVKGLVNPKEYAQAINNQRNPTIWDEPQIKQINKSINDIFQRWTRAYLSGQLSINDVDAFTLVTTSSGKKVIVICELKRSKIKLKDWQPYLDDVPNYMLAKACTLKIPQSIDLTIHYSEENKNQVAIHLLGAVTWEGISGFRKIISGENSNDVITKIQCYISEMLDDAYTSINRNNFHI